MPQGSTGSPRHSRCTIASTKGYKVSTPALMASDRGRSENEALEASDRQCQKVAEDRS